MEDIIISSDESELDIMLPGFRFHPTDEELVGFYLKRKIHQFPLSIELIKQLDIYKYDPWDLPKLALTGEKEWYFYCPRDRKYRNSSRPNRVTESGFWKATGTDRPIYSSSSSSSSSTTNIIGLKKCIIGLKKSLVFYKGRSAKAVKTDWMMHEFRLPSTSSLHHSNRPTNNNNNTIFSPNDSWAICRIFKKMNATRQRAVSKSRVVSPLLIPKASIRNIQHEEHNSCMSNNNALLLPNEEDNSSELLVPLPLCCDNNINDIHFPTPPNFSKTDHPCNNFENFNDPLFDYLDGKLPQLSIPNEPSFNPNFFTFPPMEALLHMSSSTSSSTSVVGNLVTAESLDQIDHDEQSNNRINSCLFPVTLIQEEEEWNGFF